MDTLVTLLTVIALVMINSLTLTYQPRTALGKVFYVLLLVPMFLLILSAILLVLEV